MLNKKEQELIEKAKIRLLNEFADEINSDILNLAIQGCSMRTDEADVDEERVYQLIKYDLICWSLPCALFENAVKKFGAPLWNGEAWHKKRCYVKCPLGDYCNAQMLYFLEGSTYCIGQLYISQCCRGLSTLPIPILTSWELCGITNSELLPFDEEQYSKVDKIFHFIFEFSPYCNTSEYRYKRKTEMYPGGNVIPFL